MADLNEKNIKFGWLTKSELLDAISDGNLNEYDICFTKDTHEQYIINSKLEPVSIKSRLRIYGSVDSAMQDIQSTSCTYEGEIISIRDADKFIAYIVNKFTDGTYYLSPIYSDTQVDYNDLQNVPIKNLVGSSKKPIIINNLEEGNYNIKGKFITPDGVEIESIVGNYVIVAYESVGIKNIKRINAKSVVDYIVSSGGVIVHKYVTDEYIREQGFVTNDYLDTSLEAFKIATEQYIQEYVATTCTLLIKTLINQELDNRYADKSDITALF